MTVQDMDICLNISTGPIGRKSFDSQKQQNVDDYVKPSLKRLDKECKKTVDQTKTKITSQNVNKRIKQKCLSAIVAKKLKDVKETSNFDRSKNEKNDCKSSADGRNKISESKSNDTSSTLPNTNSNTSAVLSDKNKSKKSDSVTSVINKEQNLKTSEVSPEKNNSQDGDSFITFTKVTPANVGKTIVAKKRNSEGVESKKSLSDIFSKQSNNKSLDFKLVNSETSNLAESSTPNSEANIRSFQAKQQKNNIKKNVEKPLINHKKDKKHKTKVAHGETNEYEHKVYKSHGKISSLFGNNPDIPNIGQRLVKPVNEVVFTGTSFSDLDVHPFMVSNLEQNMQITKMTMVQQMAIPHIFSGKDILVRSQTGSGKTLAYALPIVELLHKIRPKLTRNSGLNALVIVPTRELALQTYECFLKLVKPFTWIVPGYLVGGEKRKAEKARLRKGCNILIATPGRLLDHIKHTSALKLVDVKYFVLDEADRMFDMGYEKDISGIVDALKSATPDNDNSGYNAMDMLRQNIKKVFTDEETAFEETNQVTKKKIYNSDSESRNESDSGDESKIKVKKKENTLKQSSKKQKEDLNINVRTEISENKETTSDTCASKRQTILLSATLTQAVEKLAGLTMQNPLFVDAAKENLESVQGNMSEINEDLIVPQSVMQSYIVTPPKLRMVTLAAYITGKCQGSGKHRIVVFMATQDMIDYHTDMLSSVLTKPQDEDDEDSDPLVDVEFFKLHGSMTQKERTEVFKTFRQAKCSGVLLCTDVAARGLDMPKVDCVIQYTGPLSARDYVHRIGRTARAGSSGTATIFLTPPEVEFVRLLESRRVRIKQEDMNDVLDKLLGPLSKHRSTQATAIALQNEFESLVLEQKAFREKAYKAYVSWIRFYSSYPREMREIFDRKQLHLGHYAKSFALRDPPKRIGGIGKTLREKDNTKPQHKNRLSNEPRPDEVALQKNRQAKEVDRITPSMLKRVRMLNTSEFGSGLEPIKKPKRS